MQARRHSSVNLLALFVLSSLFCRESIAWAPNHLATRPIIGLQQCQQNDRLVRLYASDNDDDTAADNTANGCPVKTGDRNGLIRHEIIAEDGHPLRLYSRAHSSEDWKCMGSILLLHGRTWSSQPVFDLRTSNTDERMQSLLQTLNRLGFAAYTLDFRGFGETPRDSSGYTTPQRCVDDVHVAIEWIKEQHKVDQTALLGWSQGALVAQLYAQSQNGRESLSSLTLFGTIYDPRVVYPRRPLYETLSEAPQTPNTEAAALEDFTLPGSICDEAAESFGNLALASDPIKAEWNELHEFNACSPAMVHVPTHVIAGQQDPYVSWEAQRELFDRLGTDDKVWTILPGCDHAAHILQKRRMFVRAVVAFLRRLDHDLSSLN